MSHNTSLTIKESLVEKSNDFTFLEKKYKDKTGINLFDPFAPPASITSKTLLTVSIIIPAWNAKGTILACLSAIEKSSFNLQYQDHLQVIVIDDGSNDGTWEIIKKSQFLLNLTGVKIQHSSRAKACNTGVSVASGKLLLFCDADMILSYFTIEHLVSKHLLLPNAVLIGFRTNTNSIDPRVDTHNISKYGSPVGTYITGDERLSFPTVGWPSSMCLSSNHYKDLGYNRGLWMPDDKLCKDPWLLCDQVFGALFSLTKEVFIDIGGYDESFTGWGCEDSFLAAKAIANGQYVIPIYAASGLHISHLVRSGDKKWNEYKRNRKLFFELILKSRIENYSDWLNQAKNRIVKSFKQDALNKPRNPTLKNNISKNNELTLDGVDTLLAIGNYNQTFLVLSKKIEKIKNDPIWLSRLARTFSGMGCYQNAIDILENLKINDLSLETTLDLAIAYASRGDYISAHSTLKKLSEINPLVPGLLYWYQTSTESHIRQGRKFLEQGFYEVASRCFDAALIIEPKNKIVQKYRNQCIKKKN